jgi:uncharacterized membrane protein YgdD (TMEM256/DUF423 family)
LTKAKSSYSLNKKIAAYACFILALGIILGAMAAHALEKLISAEQLNSFETAVDYHIYHGLGLLILSFFGKVLTEKQLTLLFRLFVTGLIFFSGSIYFLSTSTVYGLQNINSIVGPITPIGGLILITTWVVFGVMLLKKKANS